MLDGRFRVNIEKGLRPVGASLKNAGVSADHLTALGVGMAGAAAVAIGFGNLPLGLLFLVLTGVPDALDGAVAKASGSASPRGAFFDSVADRVSDALLLGGVAWYLATSDPRAHRPAAHGRAGRLHAHLLRAGPGRGPGLQRQGRAHGAGRAPDPAGPGGCCSRPCSCRCCGSCWSSPWSPPGSAS